MQRVTRHPPCPVTAGAQTLQQILRAFDRRSGWGVKPLQFEWVPYTHGAQRETQLRQLPAQNLWRILLAPALEILDRKEPDHTPRRSARRAACPLRSRCLADARPFECRQSRPRGIA